ncbi:MAG: EthD family reductase [Thermoleophilia bacterium]|nr:EthD family reductase [Thermoleophilia bacterium]
MFKAIILLTRKEGMTHEAFLSHWEHSHLPLARTLPRLRRLVFNTVLDPEAPYDGVAELWFDSREDMEAAYASEIGKVVAADSLAHVSTRVRMPVAEQAILG